MPAVSPLPEASARRSEVDGSRRSADNAVVPLTSVEIPTRVLVFGMVRPDGSVPAAELYPVAAACGQNAEQVRSCVRRLVAEGLMVREGSGRSAVYRTTEAGDTLVGGSLERHQRAYLQDSQGRGWDGRWHLVAFAVPESRRAARDRLRERLTRLGGAAVTNGLYVSPHPWEKDVRDAASALGVADRLTLASGDELEVSGVRAAPEIARTLWPVDELAQAYERFLVEFSDTVPLLERFRSHHRRITDTEFLPGALRIVVVFQEVFARDPLLPPELLPRPWPGRAARRAAARPPAGSGYACARSTNDRPCSAASTT